MNRPLIPGTAMGSIRGRDSSSSSSHIFIRPSPHCTLVLFLCGIWYSTSGWNNVAVRLLVGQLRNEEAMELDTSPATSLLVMSVVTTLQLGCGALMGSLFLWAVRMRLRLRTSPTVGVGVGSVAITGSWEKEWRFDAATAVSCLHGLGSYATNMGYCYGSATLVQQVKLLEPMETLLVSVLVSRFIGGDLRAFDAVRSDVVGSVALVVFGAVLAIQGGAAGKASSQRGVNLYAINYALLSGVALSCRNVFKKYDQQQRKKKMQKDTNHVEVGDSTTHTVTLTDKLTTQLSSFTDLSIGSCAFMSACTAFWISCMSLCMTSSTPPLQIALVCLRVTFCEPSVLIYHASYNLASLSVLSMVAASTHSLYNVGKRYSNIVTSMRAFHETGGIQIVVGMIMSAAGSLWYWRVKTTPTTTTMTFMTTFLGSFRRRLSMFLVCVCITLMICGVSNTPHVELPADVAVNVHVDFNVDVDPIDSSSSNCSVVFRDPSNRICPTEYDDDDDFATSMSVAVALRVLENRFTGCTVRASDLLLVPDGVSQSRRPNNGHCLFLYGDGGTNSSVVSGDFVWGSNRNHRDNYTTDDTDTFTVASPPFLVPFLFDYTGRPSFNTTVCVSTTATVHSSPSSKWDWGVVGRRSWRDDVTVLVDQCAELMVPPRIQSAVRTVAEALGRPVSTSNTNPSFHVRPLHERRRIADSLISSFPYHLFHTRTTNTTTTTTTITTRNNENEDEKEKK